MADAQQPTNHMAVIDRFEGSGAAGFTTRQAIAAIRAELPDAPDNAVLEQLISDYAMLGCFPVSPRNRAIQHFHAHRALMALIEAAEAGGLEDKDVVLGPKRRGGQH